jgi:hypothetical protein
MLEGVTSALNVDACLSAERLAAWTSAESEQHFKLPAAARETIALVELNGLITSAMTSTGAALIQRGCRSLGDLALRAISSSAASPTPPRVGDLVRALVEAVPAYSDSAPNGVHLLKKAQLVTCHLYELIAARDARFAFVDIDRLTVFADNVLPAMLRAAQCVRLAPELAARIDAGDELAIDSDEEVAVRATAVAACEAVIAACADISTRESSPVEAPAASMVTTRELDLLLWGVMGKAEGHRDAPRHMTKGTWKY